MARAARKGDTSYNARRREYRAAQRYLKRANETSGATAEKNRALARTHLMNALETYDYSAKPQKISSQIINVGTALGIDVENARSGYLGSLYSDAGGSGVQYARAAKKQEEAIARSYEALETTRKQQRTELEAKELISNKVIGKRIMGGLVDVWRDKVSPGNSAVENRRTIQKAIFDFFKVSSWVEILEKLEKFIGSALYSLQSELEIYETVKLAIQKGVTGNTLVA